MLKNKNFQSIKLINNLKKLYFKQVGLPKSYEGMTCHALNSASNLENSCGFDTTRHVPQQSI